jgi:hypothetical protein
MNMTWRHVAETPMALVAQDGDYAFANTRVELHDTSLRISLPLQGRIEIDLTSPGVRYISSTGRVRNFSRA